MHAAFGRDDVGAVAARDQRGVEALLIDEAVHIHGLVFVCDEAVENLGGLVDRVVAHPCARRMRGHAVRDHVETHRAVAAGLDAARRGFADDREIALDPIRVVFDDTAQTVVLGGHLLVVIEDEGQVHLRVGQRGREVEQHRVGGLHVGGAAPPHHRRARVHLGHVLVDERVAGGEPLRREVVEHRHCVEVPGQDHAVLAPQIGGRHNRVAVAVHLQVRVALEEALHAVGERALRVAHRIDGHDLAKQRVKAVLHGSVRVKHDLARLDVERSGLCGRQVFLGVGFGVSRGHVASPV